MDRKDLLSKVSISVVVDQTKEKQKRRLTKEELLRKVQEMVELSSMMDTNPEDFQYMLHLYRKLQNRDIKCPCLNKVKKLTAGYLRDRVSTASEKNHVQIDPDDLIDEDGNYL